MLVLTPPLNVAEVLTSKAKLSAPEAPSGTMLMRCSTAWPSPIPCGHALSTLLCTFETALTTAQSVSPVAFLSLSLRRRCLTRPSSVSSGAPSSPRCPTCRVGNSAKKRFVASWSAIRLTPLGTASTNFETRRITTSVHVVFHENTPGFGTRLPIEPCKHS
jgi:hypothetical protein